MEECDRRAESLPCAFPLQNICKRCYGGNLVSIHNYRANHHILLHASKINQAQVWIGGFLKGWVSCEHRPGPGSSFQSSQGSGGEPVLCVLQQAAGIIESSRRFIIAVLGDTLPRWAGMSLLACGSVAHLDRRPVPSVWAAELSRQERAQYPPTPHPQ